VVDGLYVQIFGNLLFCFVFLFLWRQSGVVYFKFWALAWGAESLALLFTGIARISRSTRWLIPHAFLEFAFALSLVAAARAASKRPSVRWTGWLRLLLLLPVVLLVVELLRWNERYALFQGVHSLTMAVIFFGSFLAFSMGREPTRSVPGNLFRFTLLGLSLLYLHHSWAYFYISHTEPRPWWLAYLDYLHFYTLALQTLLAFSTLAMWIQHQQDRVTEIAADMDLLRRETASRQDLDHLTGLLNQANLSRRNETPFDGVVAVCDMDEFKAINDRYGHLTGDEILRNIGQLLRTSIRAQDEAFRWGGDEFVVLFHNQSLARGRKRMTEISERLAEFRVRGLATLQVHFSWGAAEGGNQPLHVALEAADREMYASKRARGYHRGEIS